ncbi:MAG: Hsp20/alpha crystallin family protein [Anaerolineales bacterium]|nr:Hsp20/alpha crystallin family protein [Anaerolineales bacterium]
MANITRWEPLREIMELRRDWDRVFDDNFFRPMWSDNRRSDSARSYPAVDLYQTADDIHVKATMPGVKAEDVEIQINGDLLTIKAETQAEEERNDVTYHVRERRSHSFVRAISLPVPVKVDQARAEVSEGILHVTLPKAEEAKPKVITVKAGK